MRCVANLYGKAFGHEDASQKGTFPLHGILVFYTVVYWRPMLPSSHRVPGPVGSHVGSIASVAVPAESPPVVSLSLYASRIPAGFPSPADDYLADRIDLNEHLIEHPSATFYVRVQGDSQRDNGIFNGDVLVVDRSKEAVSGSIVVTAIHGDLAIKQLEITGSGIRLLSANPAYPPIQVTNPDELTIWGVVTGVVRKF